MYFLPHTHWLCVRLAPLSSIQRYGITLLFLGSLIGVWYYGLYCRIAQRIAATNTLLQTTEFTPDLLASEQELETAVKKAESAWHDYNAAWKTDGIEILLDYITKSGLSFVSSDITTKQYIARGHKTIDQQLLQDTISLRVIGTLKQCSYFLSLIANSNIAFVGEHIEVAPTDNDLYIMSCVLTVITHS